MSPEAFELVKTTLQIFVEIEQTVGDIWERIAHWFPHSEIEGACSVISSMEKSVHAFFYQKMSDVLNIEPEATLRIQQEVSSLKNKLSLLDNILKNSGINKPLTLATVAMIEQVLLFSNFAMLKSFQSNGNNLIPNTVSGVDYVVNDEVLHGEFAAYLFNQYVSEAGDILDVQELHENILTVLEDVLQHEDAVIDYTFKNDITVNGVNRQQLKAFIRQRANHVLTLLNMTPIYNVDDTTIASWFYKGANAIKMHDFFVKGTNSYSRTWDERGFSRLELNNNND